MKLAVISGPFSSIGGIERLILEINRRLHDKISITVIIPYAKRSSEVDAWIKRYEGSGKIKFYRYMKRGMLPGGLGHIIRILRDSDIVYFTTLSPVQNFSIYALAMLMMRRRIIYAMHTKYFSEDVRRGKSSVRMFASRMRYAFMLKTAINVHLDNKDDLRKYEKKMKRVYYIPPVLRIGRREMKKEGGTFKVLFVGRLDAFNKGLDILCDVIREVSKKAGRIEFDVVGEGKDRDILAKLGSGSLKLLGNLSDSALDKEYAEADLFAFPSRFENFGIALLEAQMRGIPAVAFDITGPRDIMSNKAQGRLAKPFDAKEFASYVLEYYRLWKKDRNAYHLMRAEISEEAMRRFDPEKSAALFLSMLREVAGSR